MCRSQAGLHGSNETPITSDISSRSVATSEFSVICWYYIVTYMSPIGSGRRHLPTHSFIEGRVSPCNISRDWRIYLKFDNKKYGMRRRYDTHRRWIRHSGKKRKTRLVVVDASESRLEECTWLANSLSAFLIVSTLEEPRRVD